MIQIKFCFDWLSGLGEYLAGTEDMYKSFGEFKFRVDSTTDYGVSCPLASENKCLMLWPF